MIPPSLRIKLLSLGLAAVFGLGACAPAAAPEPTVAVSTTQATATLAPATEPAAPTAVPIENPSATPLAVATSRGPALEATDPTTVSLAAGELQLVEFFRFT